MEQQQLEHGRVYVGNLSWKVTDEELLEVMETVGPVVSCRIMMERPRGGRGAPRSKGCALVEYENAKDAMAAMVQLKDQEVSGRPIFVREDREGKKKSSAKPFANVGNSPARNESSQPSQGQQKPIGAGRNKENGSGVSSLAGQFGGLDVKEGKANKGPANPTRLYVGNLDYGVTSDDLTSHFSQVGKVVGCEVMRAGQGRSKGCAIVQMGSVEDAQKAIQTLTDTQVKGRPIFVREDREGGNRALRPDGAEGAGTASCRVFVGNLSFRCAWQDLKDHCKQAGEVVQADVFMGSDGRSKGCGIVEFRTPDEAQRAIEELNETLLLGRPCYLRKDEKRK